MSKHSRSVHALSLTSCRAPANAILAPNFKFEDMGIGGLDSEFSTIFRRAFASRVFPPSIVEKLGIQHVKGQLPPMTSMCVLIVLVRYSLARTSGYG